MKHNQLAQLLLRLVFLSLSFLALPSQAGSNCNKHQASPALFAQASRQAIALEKQLNDSKAQVVLLSRVGSDLSQYGLHYSHTSFAIKDYPQRKGSWAVVHLLNHCGTDQSDIYAQGLMNFFMDNLYTMDYLITIPNADLQKKLDKNLRTAMATRLHDPHYNMLAYPFSTQYQNSNQWVLEFIEASNSGKSARPLIQKNLQNKGYKPSAITISSLKKIGASAFESNIKFDDHPVEERKRNHYSVVTVDSVIEYLKKQGIWVANVEKRGNA